MDNEIIKTGLLAQAAIPDSIEISSPEDVEKLRDHLNRKEEHCLQTCFPSINSLTRGNRHENTGGWRPGSLYSIMGLSGSGSSVFLTNFARDSWASGKNVLYISTEMDHLDTLDRIIKSYYEVDSLNKVILAKDKKTFPTGKIEVVKVHPGDERYIDIQRIFDNLDWKPDILYIDSADDIRSHEKSCNDYERLGFICEGLKILAWQNNVPVITSIHAEKSAEKRKIKYVDMLFSIIQSIEEKDNNIINLLVLRNRFGNSNVKISFKIDYEKMILSEVKSVDNELMIHFLR